MVVNVIVIIIIGENEKKKGWESQALPTKKNEVGKPTSIQRPIVYSGVGKSILLCLLWDVEAEIILLLLIPQNTSRRILIIKFQRINGEKQNI